MIKLTRTSGKEFVLNADLIVEVQETPDTVITLTNGKKLLVKDTADDIINKVVNFRQEIMAGISRTGERS
ncbi:flagellar FlbD family protein [Halanaerobium saccharolyticum]|nr:flagellar FlbD family protein [Halanaerobium saccharolyticum]